MKMIHALGLFLFLILKKKANRQINKHAMDDKKSSERVGGQNRNKTKNICSRFWRLKKKTMFLPLPTFKDKKEKKRKNQNSKRDSAIGINAAALSSLAPDPTNTNIDEVAL